MSFKSLEVNQPVLANMSMIEPQKDRTCIGEGDWSGCKLKIYNPFRVFAPLDHRNVPQHGFLFTGIQFALELPTAKASELKALNIAISLSSVSPGVANRPTVWEMYPNEDTSEAISQGVGKETAGSSINKSKRRERTGKTTTNRNNARRAAASIVGPAEPPPFWNSFEPSSLVIKQTGISSYKASWRITLPPGIQSFPPILPVGLVVMHQMGFIGNIEVDGKGRILPAFTAFKTKPGDALTMRFDYQGWAMDV